ncbi:uncharacterized protein A1O5_08758 [Cladophialophora psammophila CBS 110553]|uniref:Uncharacterized protein n=1 Tax=Cladophialophora psammophila CBS 110553 TaxID=1182543 RepID=W9WJP0_9EURO|nr:uncharacterized protein A1O5_08758 [Cladophialophora psammophila CBS 110553]EXJ68143.1 hypothetical protein A1O5_08758 [Cladophialophora psammophila CBS 110553]
MSHTASSTVTEHRETAPVPAEVNNTAYVPNYNETDYSDFLYLAPSLSSEFLPLEPTDNKAARTMVKKSKVRPAETFNTGTTPPPATPADEKSYAKATFPLSGGQSPAADEMAKAAERRERRPSFVEVTPVKVHHEHDKHHKDAHGHHHPQRRRSSHESGPMSWWPENETLAQHEWVEQNEEEDVIEDDVWSDAFYE